MNDKNSETELDKVSEIWISFFLLALAIGFAVFFLLVYFSTLKPLVIVIIALVIGIVAGYFASRARPIRKLITILFFIIPF